MEEVAKKIETIKVENGYTDQNLRDAAIDNRQAWDDYIAEECDIRNDSCASACSHPHTERGFLRLFCNTNEPPIRRWTVNYIRHNLTEYDETLFGMSGKVGCREAYILDRYDILDKIAETYPQYRTVCQRQKAA